jgi:hypothetical protein
MKEKRMVNAYCQLHCYERTVVWQIDNRIIVVQSAGSPMEDVDDGAVARMPNGPITGEVLGDQCAFERQDDRCCGCCVLRADNVT